MNLPITLRCSGLDRIFSCPGSLIAAPLVPPPKDTRESTDGTICHFLGASKLVVEHGALPPEGGLPTPKMPEGYTLNPFMAWIPEWWTRLVVSEIPADWSLMVEPEFAERIELTAPVWIPVSEIHGPIPADHEVKDGMVCIRYVILTAHLDALGISPDGTEAVGGDLKSGNVGADAAESNWQASGYIVVARAAWPTIQKMKFFMGQPMIDEEATGIPKVSYVNLEGDRLDRMRDTLAEHIRRALENRFTTDDSPKACKYCPVAKQRPWLCPSLKLELSQMKATLTPDALAAMKEQPNDAQLGDFVAGGRTLAGPVEDATELLKDRIRANGYADAGCGIRFTLKTRPGKYTVDDAETFYARAEEDLGRERMPLVFTPSMTVLKDQIAEAKGLPKTAKQGPSAAALFDERYRPLTTQAQVEVLVISQ